MTIRLLLTIPISHYCEKARWGLERLGLAYHEEAHIQGFHYWRTWRLSRQPLVPVLIDDGETITGSASILRHLERYARPENKLYPDAPLLRAQVEELEGMFDNVLGVESRRWFYFQYRQQPVSAILNLVAQRVPAHERLMARWLMRPMQEFARRRLNISLESVEAGLEQVRRILVRTDALLAGGRRYLLGDWFTAADLSFACLMAPFTLPHRYGVRLPDPEELPAAMQTTAREISQSPSGQYAIRLFEEERPVLSPCR